MSFLIIPWLSRKVSKENFLENEILFRSKNTTNSKAVTLGNKIKTQITNNTIYYFKKVSWNIIGLLLSMNIILQFKIIWVQYTLRNH